MAAAYIEVLDKIVFVNEIAEDAKAKRSHQRALSTQEAFSFFQLLWKESRFVNDAELQAAGLPRIFSNGQINCHRLAIELAETPAEVGAIIKRVRSLLRAGAVYGLVHEVRIGPKKYTVCGTSLLHQVMIAVVSTQAAILESQSNPETGLGHDE